ncbi:Bardet-Biedl syndrome 1 protein homolog isoform X2 [Athalia rosae]|uniref:Bardet-Biedl syndrome 1 protein homolog isoform X2 n=1 Tax=Athalia rosae TaxID=37344 RepID=UPI002033E123|nr:Bardet-Biedl syndrome 1 protein homolog isoform X2 [Athalia rosae]
MTTFNKDKPAIAAELRGSRWLEAVWEPGARLYVLPGGLEVLDVSGEEDPRLVCADLGTATMNSSKIRVYKGGDPITEHHLGDCPSGVVGFYSENRELESAALAVAAGSSVYIYKNMRPYFKYCLPPIEPHPREREIWHRAGLEDDPNVLMLTDELELLQKELGGSLITPRTLKLLSMEISLRPNFIEQYRRVPLSRPGVATTIGIIRKDSLNDPASSCLLIGTEHGQILVLDTRAFTVIDRLLLGWAPVAIIGVGLWSGGGRVVVIGRNGELGSAERGSGSKLWHQFPAPAVSLSRLPNDGAAVAVMDGSLWGFSKKGACLWNLELPNIPLDLVGLPISQRRFSLLAVSVAGYGVRIYDGKHHVDSINTMEAVSALKYGRLGQEERAMSMITVGGGLNVKILKRTADFTTHTTPVLPSNVGAHFAIPKKTRLFVEQTIRERAEAVKIHDIFHQGLTRLKVHTAKEAANKLTNNQDFGHCPVIIDASVLGLGPNYMIKISVINISDGLSDTGFFIACSGENSDVKPRVIRLPLLPSSVPIPLVINASPWSMISGKIKIMLCRIGRVKPIALASVVLPACEEDIEI